MGLAYRADQVGSLLRPTELLEARAARAQGRLAADALRMIEDQAILDALELQRRVGLDVYMDGEFRRTGWMTDLIDAVEGFVPERVPIEWRGPGGGVEGSLAHVAGGRLRQVRRLAGHESSFLKAHAPGPIKMTVPSPSVFMLISYKPGITDKFYATRSDFLRELVPIVHGELRALIDEGVPYVQLDAPQYGNYVDPQLREQIRRVGVDPHRAFDEAVAVDNACFQGLAREGVTTAIHICRGNNMSRWFAEGGYDPIAEKLFGGIQADRFLLEYDTERAGGFEPLRFVPKGRTVVLGLITTKGARLEPEEELLRRIDGAARYVPLENLAISPQCGFASNALGNTLTPDDQRRKLELVAKVARRVWDDR
jgi:5-methyltetrahydropteroyltriglutamate--homocysteine methyltransferase